ncbi:hypothetical protein GL279_06280 [Paracoccus limosus]|uniref:O-antigen ligase domain-containing protein n=2 Tax=Paracoccus limosus TaxID=913252 RepID=A0A844H7A1_9RHOB|nr:hypothetical protein [Paracoccus limosus]
MMLLLWPAVTAVIFARMDKQAALVCTILLGYLILPPLIDIDLPLVPGIGKPMIPALSAALILFLRRDIPDEVPRPPEYGTLVTVLLVLVMVQPMLTALTNPDTLYDGINVRPGLTIANGLADTMLVYMQILPFLLGFRWLSDLRGAELLMRGLVTGILCYSLLMLFEMRFSPQSNIIVYGYFQHDFSQTVRYGGFRPIVFLEHPLWVALITMWAFLSAIVLARGNPTRRNVLIACYLGCILVLCKTAGSLIQAMMAAPLILLARPRVMVLVAALVGSVSLAYPMLRASPMSPMQAIVNTAMAVSPERGRSLEFRLVNEEKLLERALERPVLGWGGWGRSLFYDPVDGKLSAIPDGVWVIWIGAKGILGYMAIFLLLLTPIWTMMRAIPGGKGSGRKYELLVMGCLSLMVAMNCLDLLPNATQTPMTWLAAGTLLGNARRLLKHAPQPDAGPVAVGSLPKKAGIRTVL